MATPEWEALLAQSRTSAEEAARMAALRRQAGIYLWAGAKALIETWNCDADPLGDALYQDALTVLGKNRKSAASKIRTVALATRDLDLHTQCYASLNEAYRNTKRLAEGVSSPVLAVAPPTEGV